MPDTRLRRRLDQLASEFASQVLVAIRAASIEDLLSETGHAGSEVRTIPESRRRLRAGPRPQRRSAERVTAATATSPGSQRALGVMKGKLRVAIAHSDDPLQRYDAGAIIAAVKQGRERYGDSAVPVLAAAVGESVVNLYRFAKVAECWSRRQVRHLLAQGVTWSHLVALVWHVDPNERASWLKRIKRERLSVRDLEIRLGR